MIARRRMTGVPRHWREEKSQLLSLAAEQPLLGSQDFQSAASVRDFQLP